MFDQKKYAQEYYQGHKEEYRNKLRDWRKKNNERFLENQRAYHKNTHNAAYHKNGKTLKGFLVRKYRNMKSRVEGIQWEKQHLYKGKEILPKQQFYEWSLNHPNLLVLFHEWTVGNYDRRLTPTIDRIDSSLGYVLENMRWITFSENCKQRWKKTS